MRETTWTKIRLLPSLVLLITWGWGCRSERVEVPPLVDLVLAPAVGATGCPIEGDRELSETGLDVDRLRVTFYSSGASGPSADSFVCDRVLSRSEANKTFYLDGTSLELDTVDITVEAYTETGSGTLDTVAVGRARDVAIEASGRTPLIL